MPTPKKYPDELKERAVRLVFESGRPIAHVAEDLGVHREALRLWVHQAETELIADRVRRTRAQLELAIVEWPGWFNERRLHGALGDLPPAEAELEHALAAHAPQRAVTRASVEQ